MKKSVFLLAIIMLFSLFGCTENIVSESQSEIFEEEPLLEEETEHEEETMPEGAAEKQEEEPERKAETKTYVRSLTNGLSVRSGPGTKYDKTGTLDAGDMAAYCGTEGEWHRTFYRGRVAYVSAKYSGLTEMTVADERTESVIALGEKYLGTPYVYGATRLHDGQGRLLKNFTDTEFDCSSYMQYIFYYGADVVLRETTRTQVTQGIAVQKDELQRGDLIFMTNSSRKNLTGVERIGHVALYLGDNYILHTASDHAVIEKMTAARWNNYVTARRMI